MGATPLSEIQSTKRQFLVLVTGEYLITGYFWVFSALGSLLLLKEGEKGAELTFFFTMFVLMLSNGVWEILTGWYADKFKRQLSMSAGFLACCVGFCLMGVASLVPTGAAPTGAALATNFKLLVWYAGVSIWALGPALLSGAEEAWLVDRCNFFSTDPPEDVDDVFKRSAAYGVLAKSLGTLVCFVVLAQNFSGMGRRDNWPVFVLSAIIAVVVSAWLFFISRHLREEYWSHPKYQTNEPLFSFLGKGLHDLWETPFRWFAISYVGVMSLNYVLSSTVWTYMTVKAPHLQLRFISKDENLLFGWAITLILAQLIGSVLSRPFSRWIDLIRQRWLRIPIASLMYLVPITFLLIYPDYFLYVLIVVASLFQVVHASVFGSLNTIGQLAIKSDERRAVLVSMSSAISSFLMSLVFLAFYEYASNSTGVSEIDRHLEHFWYVALPFILMVAVGGYLATRLRPEAR